MISLQNSPNSHSKTYKDEVFSINKGWFGHFSKETLNSEGSPNAKTKEPPF